MLEGDSIAHQEEAVGQPAVAKEDLGILFELVFGTADHLKLVEFVFGPCRLEIVDVWVDLGLLLFLLLLSPDFALLQAIGIAVGAQLVVELFDQFEVFHQFRMHPFKSLQSLELRLAEDCLHFRVDLLQKRQTHFIVEVDKGQNVRMVGIVLCSQAWQKILQIDR